MCVYTYIYIHIHIYIYIYTHIYIYKSKMEVTHTKALIVLGGDLGIHQTLSLGSLVTRTCDLPSRGDFLKKPRG